MYVCVCNGLRERDIHEAVDSGSVSSLSAFYREKGIQPCCAKCVPDVKKHIDARLSIRTNPSAVAAE